MIDRFYIYFQIRMIVNARRGINTSQILKTGRPILKLQLGQEKATKSQEIRYSQLMYQRAQFYKVINVQKCDLVLENNVKLVKIFI
jgi:hypothetical protein